MARNRVIYQSEALFVSREHNSTGQTDHLQLQRVQSANYNFSIARQDINQYGQLSRIDTMVLEAPTVSLDTSYYITDGFNERVLGFYVQNVTGYAWNSTGAGGTTTGQIYQAAYLPAPASASGMAAGTPAAPSGTFTSAEASFISGHMTATNGDNLYILTSPEGYDANSLTGSAASGNSSIIGIGNAFVSNYSLELAVGAIPTASISFEAANINAQRNLAAGTGITTTGVGFTGYFTGYSGVNVPAINPQNGNLLNLTGYLPFANSATGSITAVRAGDIVFDIANFKTSGIASLDTGDGGIHIQSASIAIPLSRSPLQRLGSKFPFARTVDFPIKATISISAIVNEANSMNLANVISTTDEKDLSITLRSEAGVDALKVSLKGCTLDSESFSSSIGSNKSVDLVFSTQIGGIKDITHGIFMSGSSILQAF